MRHRVFASVIGTAFLAMTIEGAGAASGSSPAPTAVQVRGDYDSGAAFVDVRTDDEWNAGHVRGALHLPVDTIGNTAAAALPDKNRRIVVYCRSGKRAERAAETLRAAGYGNVVSITGGYEDLKAAGVPVER